MFKLSPFLAPPSLTVVGAVSESTTVTTSSHTRSSTRAWSGCAGWVCAEHAHSGAKLGSTQRDHVLSNMGDDGFYVLRILGIVNDPLNQVVAVLIRRDVNDGQAGPVIVSLGNLVQISLTKLAASNLEALFHNLRGKLVEAILHGIANNVVDSPSAIGWCTMLANVLNAPVAKLAMGDQVNISEDLFNARALHRDKRALESVRIMISSPRRKAQREEKEKENIPCLPRGNSQRCFEQQDCPFPQAQPRATFR